VSAKRKSGGPSTSWSSKWSAAIGRRRTSGVSRKFLKQLRNLFRFAPFLSPEGTEEVEGNSGGWWAGEPDR
jgi:hypothetical protein